ncbi:MAG: ATPase [Oscillospiraceae bacterium]|nr:ATPase [Oscillospiraceae bacterium]
MNIENTLDMMGDVLDRAVAVPFSGKKSLIDIEKMDSLIYEIRSNLPREIEQARKIVREAKSIENDARREADRIIRKAEERARELVKNQEITRLAQARAEEIMLAAQQKSRELRNTTNDYIDQMLAKNEELHAHSLSDIKKARMSIRNSGR